MEDLSVTLIQTSLFWEDIDANLNHFSTLIKNIDIPTDLIILPEMFSTGFSMVPEKLAETIDGKAVNWMKATARQTNAVICGSLILEEEGNYYNRLVWMTPDGNMKTYDKRHLFSLAKEEEHYESGKERLIVTLKGWRICPLVCYDLRFPVWSRNNHCYDFAFYVANWPERRNYPWKQLLIARAIENQSYIAGVNRIGDDGNGVSHSGDSALIDPLGEILSTLEPHKEGIETLTLKADHLARIRNKFSFLNDQDQFEILVD